MLGSTIVLVFEAPDNLVFNFKSGEVIRLGQALCTFDTTADVNSSPLTQDPELSSLSTDDDEDSVDEDADIDILTTEHSLLLDAAIADADDIADQELINRDE